MNKRIRLSACMMVRNEEKNLPRCLESIKDIVDEIIVVDTGSTDATMEIARAFGAKVYEHPWENDFSKHRNQSIGYATGDFVLIVDADEEIKRNAPISKLRELLRDLPDTYDALIVEVQDIQRGDVMLRFQSARVFRREAVRYIGTVHNRPVTPTGAGLVTNFLELRHYGYDLTPDEKERKFIRSTTLLKKRLEDNPEDYECHFYLAQMYMDHGMAREGMDHGARYAEYRDREEFSESIWFSLVRTAIEADEPAAAASWLRQGLERIPEDLDLYFGMVELGVRQKDIELVIRGAKHYMRIYEEQKRLPILKEKRFVYTATDRSMAWVCGAIAMTCMDFGTSALKKVESLAPGLDPSYAATLLRTIQAALQDTAIPINFDIATDEKKIVTAAGR